MGNLRSVDGVISKDPLFFGVLIPSLDVKMLPHWHIDSPNESSKAHVQDY